MPLTGSRPDDPQKVSVPIAHQLAGMYGAHGELSGPPPRFFDADGNETARTAHHAPPTFDEHGARIRVEAGARDPMRGES
jgi:hypothetical protein